MERIQLPDSHTAVYFCEYWCANKWVANHVDTYPGIHSVECDLRPRDCVYCFGCGARIARGSACVLCSEGRPCPVWDWIMTDAAVQFGQALARRRRTLSAERGAAAEFLVRLDPTLTGEELAEIILGEAPEFRPDGTDWAGDAPEAA